nr:hypothetical protein Itr_chr14CG27290 [Ipomoea trifida]
MVKNKKVEVLNVEEPWGIQFIGSFETDKERWGLHRRIEIWGLKVPPKYVEVSPCDLEDERVYLFHALSSSTSIPLNGSWRVDDEIHERVLTS